MFKHYSVLNEEAIDGLKIREDGTYVDCTLGGAGHTLKILERLSQKGKLIAFDQDIHAIENAKKNLTHYKDKLILIHQNFEHLEKELDRLNVDEVDGVIFDLGVSSPQLDEAERGFSYQHDAPLDMRMNQSDAISAYDIVNDWSYEQLVKTFFQYGEEKFSKQIARNIEKTREKKPIETTFELVDIIKDSIPAFARRKGGHPAKRIFQAIRIAVNNELNVLEQALNQAARKVAIGGRICVITFHSLEDRICKQSMKSWTTSPQIPKEIPVLPEELTPPFKMITKKPITPTDEELEENRRSRSAKLRIVEKIKKWDEQFAFNRKGTN